VEKFGEAPNGHLKVKRNRSFQFSGVEEGTKELLRISHLRSKKVCQIAVDLCVFVFFQPRESHRICAHRNVVQVEALRDIFLEIDADHSSLEPCLQRGKIPERIAMRRICDIADMISPKYECVNWEDV
jgi:hypothetical protein